MIIDNGYKSADGPVCSLPEFSDLSFAVASGQSIGDSHIIFDLEDQGESILMTKVLLLIITLEHRFSLRMYVGSLMIILMPWIQSKMTATSWRCPVYSAKKNF